MFVTDEDPSGSVVMFALLRALAYTSGGGVVAPACVSPTTGSFSRNASVRPKWDDCALTFSSVKPRV
jgi:hypothetical protein